MSLSHFSFITEEVIDRARFYSSVLFCLLSCLFLSCTPSTPPADLTFVNGSEPQSLDPGLITGQLEGRLCRALFEGLTRYNQKADIVPGAAESWKVSTDSTVYTFKIREDAFWSDGLPVTAEDFVLSWKRVLTPETAAEYAYILYFIKNAEAYHRGELHDFTQVGIKATSEKTLEVTLKAPTPFFLYLTAFPTYFPVPLRAIEAHADAWGLPGKIITNGPYLLESWKIRDRVTLVKNQDYWDAERVQLNRIDSLITDKATTAFNLYATGLSDLIVDKNMVPQHIITALKDRPDFHSYTYMGTYYYRFNVTREPLNDPRVRQALSAAIDRQRIIDKITKAGEQPATSFTPPNVAGYQPPDGIAYHPEQAQALLAQAGYPNGTRFPRLSLLYNKSELHEKIAIEVQAMWKQVLGIQVDLANQEWATYLDSMKNLKYDIARSSWIGDYPDPNTFLDCFITGGGNNRTGWSRDEYDQAIEKANQTNDPKERLAIFYDAETLLVKEDPPIAPLFFYSGILFYDQNKIGGIEPNVLAEHPLDQMFIKED
ncbi:MAG: peptide ABC transporter substrate-binding protein [Verrucomicrobiota bacterium]